MRELSNTKLTRGKRISSSGLQWNGVGGEGGAERKGELIPLPNPSQFEEPYPSNIALLDLEQEYAIVNTRVRSSRV